MVKKLGNFVQDLRLPKNFHQELRFRRIVRKYGGDGVYAVLLLWSWAAENCPTTGRLETMQVEDIYDVCCVSLESKEFINDLVREDFLAKGEDGSYYLPNWREEQPYVSKAEERSNAGRAAVEKRWGARDAKRNGQEKKTQPNTAPNTEVIGEVYSNTNSNTNIKSPLTPQKGGGERNAPVKEIAELYREVLSELPQPDELTERMRRNIEARWNAKPERQSLEWWRGYFARVRERPILMGENGKWCASLAWLVCRANMDKVLGGEYPTRADAERLADGGADPKPKRGYSLEEFEQMRAEQRAAAEAAGYLDPDMP